jgi:hypothetical protein
MAFTSRSIAQVIKMRKLRWLSTLAALALAACGGSGSTPSTGAFAGGGSGGSGGGTGGGGTGGTLTVKMGNGTGTAFQAGVIGVSNASVSAGGSTSLTVSLVQSDGTLYTQSTAVTFNSACVASGTAAIQPAATATTTTGIATVTYVAKGCAGADVITATATAGTASLTASGTVTVAQAATGSIVFVSATPSAIGLKGTGAVGRPETSTVVFKVLDSSGGPRAGATVTFSLISSFSCTGANCAAGTGIQLSPLTGTTDSNGQVQTIVSAGTVATSVSVVASVTAASGTVITTQSNSLTISTGIPTVNNVSLSVQCPNVEAWDYDGVIVPVTVRMTDRFSNPVPDGTAANFRTEGGGITAQCLTSTTATESGLCTANWVSKQPRPANGRSSLMVSAIGEDSFIDQNANGIFDPPNDNATPGIGWTQAQEPFEDDNENGHWDPGEPFLDYNSDGLHQGPGPNDAPMDGKFHGVLCDDSQSATKVCSAQQSTAIGNNNNGASNTVIVMSGSTASISIKSASTAPVNGVYTLPTTFTIHVEDLRAQQMPSGTKVSASVSSGAGQLVGTSSYTWPCTAADGGSDFTFIATPPTANPQSGYVFIDVLTPKGVDNGFAINVAN